MKPSFQTIHYHFRSISCKSPFSPFFDIFTPQKKREGKLMVYLRFRSAKKAAIPMMHATATAAIIAISVLISGASVASTGAVDAGAASSGSIDCAAVGASETPNAVSAYDA
jgi:hypothetical protein